VLELAGLLQSEQGLDVAAAAAAGVALALAAVGAALAQAAAAALAGSRERETAGRQELAAACLGPVAAIEAELAAQFALRAENVLKRYGEP
jgi:hypothetical protein